MSLGALWNHLKPQTQKHGFKINEFWPNVRPQATKLSQIMFWRGHSSLALEYCWTLRHLDLRLTTLPLVLGLELVQFFLYSVLVTIFGLRSWQGDKFGDVVIFHINWTRCLPSFLFLSFLVTYQFHWPIAEKIETMETPQNRRLYFEVQ